MVKVIPVQQYITLGWDSLRYGGVVSSKSAIGGTYWPPHLRMTITFWCLFTIWAFPRVANALTHVMIAPLHENE